jgi:hypothetical protein
VVVPLTHRLFNLGRNPACERWRISA